jgi:hypothetical protein
LDCSFLNQQFACHQRSTFHNTLVFNVLSILTAEVSLTNQFKSIRISDAATMIKTRVFSASA